MQKNDLLIDGARYIALNSTGLCVVQDVLTQDTELILPKEVVIYSRSASTKEANPREAVLRQREIINNYCLENNITVKASFEDIGYSASKLDRPALNDLVKHLIESKGVIKGVIVSHPDRISRVYSDYLNFRSLLNSLGVVIILVQES